MVGCVGVVGLMHFCVGWWGGGGLCVGAGSSGSCVRLGVPLVVGERCLGAGRCDLVSPMCGGQSVMRSEFGAVVAGKIVLFLSML